MPRAAQSSPLNELIAFRTKRMRNLCYISLICVNAAMALIYLVAFHQATILMLIGLDITLFYCVYLVNKGQINKAASLLLWSLSVGLSIGVLANSGLRDPAIIAFPAILFFAALVSSRRQFGMLYIFFCSVTVLIGLTHIAGLRAEGHDPVNWPNIVVVLLILSAASYSIRTLAFDLRRALKKLELKNARLEESEAKANYLAKYDFLTGLPNRALCEDRFNNQLKQIKRDGQLGALIFIDLDNFKTINDSLGHAAGDQVLKSVADKISHCLRETDTACRFGGDEFIVLLTNIQHQNDVERICDKILAALTQPIQLTQHLINTSASMGIVMAPQDASDFDSYCRNADIAMYNAKAHGKNMYRFFDESMNTYSQERFELIKDLRNALNQQEFRLYYQPKIDLQTGQLKGAEALIRWQHPQRGLMLPAEFLPLAEETGLIMQIGHWVLTEASRQCKAWHTAGFEQLEVAVNLSPVQFSRGDLTQQVADALTQAQLQGHFLELELTETLLLSDTEKVREQIAQISRLGVTFSIDDFGTGYSNLGYLSKFDLASLKIDQSFIRRMMDSKQDVSLVKAILNIAKSLELTTIAEGIEDKYALARLTELGCQVGQGYFWAKPLCNADFLAFASTSTPYSSLTKSNSMS